MRRDVGRSSPDSEDVHDIAVDAVHGDVPEEELPVPPRSFFPQYQRKKEYDVEEHGVQLRRVAGRRERGRAGIVLIVELHGPRNERVASYAVAASVEEATVTSEDVGELA